MLNTIYYIIPNPTHNPLTGKSHNLFSEMAPVDVYNLPGLLCFVGLEGVASPLGPAFSAVPTVDIDRRLSRASRLKRTGVRNSGSQNELGHIVERVEGPRKRTDPTETASIPGGRRQRNHYGIRATSNLTTRRARLNIGSRQSCQPPGHNIAPHRSRNH